MKKNLLAFCILFLAIAAKSQTPRLSLYEEFTGETCPPCASTNPGLNALLASPTNTPKIVAIKWQVPIPSAPSNAWSLYQTYKSDIDWRWRGLTFPGYGYTPAINSAPSSKIDGQEATVFGASSGHPANLNNNVISTAQSYTSAFSIVMNRAWNVSGAIDLTVSITASAPFTAVGPLRFRCVMVERLIQFSVQPGTNGEKNFEDAAIASYPNLQTGTSMASTWTIGQNQTFTMSCMPPTYVRDRKQIAFVGFIQDDGNQKVAQCVRADKQSFPDDVAAIWAQVQPVCSGSTAPVVTIKNAGTNAITACTITPYIDGVAKNITTWSGNLAVGATTTVQLNNISTSATSGSHTFSYTISGLNAVDYNPSNNSFKTNFLVASSYNSNPVAEGFTNSTFPPAGFTQINADGGPAWSRFFVSGGFGGAYQLSDESAKYDFFTNGAIGDKDEMFLPPMNLFGTSTPSLYFDYAYSQRNAASNDQLEIYVSDNCGTTWTNIFSAAGSVLSTVAGNVNSTNFAPANVTDWTGVSLPLNNFNKSQVMVKFVTTSDKGNNLYLDNINLSQSAPTGIYKVQGQNLEVAVFPNPAKDVVSVSVGSTKQANAKITIVNTLGQILFTKQISTVVGSTTTNVDVSGFANGVYTVWVDANNSRTTSKITVNK